MTGESSISKPATRFLGIAESGIRGAKYSLLGGIVMRADLIIDGMIGGEVTIRGMDATETVIEMVQQLAREDLNGIMLHGSVIAGYNIVDISLVNQETKLPVVSITREPQEELRKHLKSSFPSDWKVRWEIVQKNGVMQPFSLATNQMVYAQFIGSDWENMKKIINKYTRFGGVPEPIRVARLFARAMVKDRQRV